MIPYMERTRTYYSTLGYPAYLWAHFDDVPFARPQAPVAESKLALITTADPYQPELLWETLLPGDKVGRTRGVNIDS